jgi:hypothetical protein
VIATLDDNVGTGEAIRSSVWGCCGSEGNIDAEAHTEVDINADMEVDVCEGDGQALVEGVDCVSLRDERRFEGSILGVHPYLGHFHSFVN